MISCPAANGIRWVKPSSAMLSPARTRPAIASRNGRNSAMALLCGPAATTLVQRQPDIIFGKARHRRLGADEILEVGNLPPLVVRGRLLVPMQHRRHPPRKALGPPGPSHASRRVLSEQLL